MLTSRIDKLAYWDRLLGAWDIIGIGSTDVVLVQVKSRDWPGAAEMETLQGFPCPPNARKLIHRWRDRQRLPDVREVLQGGEEENLCSLER